MGECFKQFNNPIPKITRNSHHGYGSWIPKRPIHGRLMAPGQAMKSMKSMGHPRFRMSHGWHRCCFCFLTKVYLKFTGLLPDAKRKFFQVFAPTNFK